MKRQTSVVIDGVFSNEDGTDLSFKEFSEKLKSVGLTLALSRGASDFKDIGANPKPVVKSKPVVKPRVIHKKSDWALIKEAEIEGIMVSMNGIVESVRTELNNKLSGLFRANEPLYTGVFDENSSVDDESVLEYINEYLEEKDINKHLSYPLSSGANMYLVPITDNLDIKVYVADEYYGGGESETYVMIDKFRITDESDESDVDELIEFVNKYLK